LNKPSNLPRSAVKHSLLSARKLHLYFDEYFTSIRAKSVKPILFNLDLHISVMRDLQQEIHAKQMKSVRWSISGSNRFSRSIYKISDPVEAINSQTWSGLDEALISQFENRYRKFLSRFDGFVVTHTPSFAQLYRSLDKPILVVNSTRYEAPYSNDKSKWKNLDSFLINSVEKKNLLLVSNNQGDADYLKYNTGINSRVFPSFCDYTNLVWRPGGLQNIIVSRSPDLDNFIEHATRGEWRGIRNVMGNSYKWKQYLDVKEVLYIPYNISTMSLFELATAGVPVAVPSSDFLKELAQSYSGVLSELSYFQMGKLSVTGLAEDDPNNYLSGNFYDWWLARADFYDENLMPNTRVISNFEELKTSRFDTQKDFDAFSEVLSKRNRSLRNNRSELIGNFATMI